MRITEHAKSTIPAKLITARLYRRCTHAASASSTEQDPGIFANVCAKNKVKKRKIKQNPLDRKKALNIRGKRTLFEPKVALFFFEP